MKKGMLRTVLSLMLVMMLALTPSLSLAAEQFGTLTNALMAEAWGAGREINAKLSLALKELTGDGIDDEETQMAMNAVSQLLDVAAINLSAVALENGVRISADAELSSQEIINGALEITPEVISAETNVLPGKRLVVKVDDVLAMTGVTMPTQEQIDQMIAMVASYAMDAATRYGGVVAQWAQGIEIKQGVGAAATDTCDAIGMTESFVLTGPQIKALIIALLDEAMADETLISALNSLGMTDNRGNAYDMAQELELSKKTIEEDTTFDPMKLTIALGYSDEYRSSVVSMMVRLTVENDPGVMLVTAQTKTAEDGAQNVAVVARLNDGTQELMNYQYAVKIATPDANTTNTTVNGMMKIADGDQGMTQNITAEGTSVVTELDETMVMNEKIDMSMPTGENVAMELGMTIVTNDLGDDFSTLYVYDMGMNGAVDGQNMALKLSMGAEVTSAAYVPSAEAMTEVDVLALSEEDMEALAAEAQSGLMQIAFTALSLLPQDLMMLVMGQ